MTGLPQPYSQHHLKRMFGRGGGGIYLKMLTHFKQLRGRGLPWILETNASKLQKCPSNLTHDHFSGWWWGMIVCFVPVATSDVHTFWMVFRSISNWSWSSYLRNGCNLCLWSCVSTHFIATRDVFTTLGLLQPYLLSFNMSNWHLFGEVIYCIINCLKGWQS